MPSVQQKNETLKKNGATPVGAPVEVNFAGVEAASGGGSQPLPIGKAYRCIVRSCEQSFKKDGSGGITYPFRFEVVEPESMAGRTAMKTMTDILNTKAAPFWKTALLSCGIKREILEKGKFKFLPVLLVGKTCYIHTGAPQAGQKWPNIEFLLPEIGAKRIAAQGEVTEETVQETVQETAAPAAAVAPADDENLFS
jgi:hypothetical protein